MPVPVCVEGQVGVFRDSHFGELKGVAGRLSGLLGWKEVFQSSYPETEENANHKGTWPSWMQDPLANLTLTEELMVFKISWGKPRGKESAVREGYRNWAHLLKRQDERKPQRVSSLSVRERSPLHCVRKNERSLFTGKQMTDLLYSWASQWLSRWRSCPQSRRLTRRKFDPWVGKIPCRRK